MANSTDVRRGIAQAGGWATRWLVAAIYVACGLASVGDLLGDNTLAFGVVYVPLIATALLHRRRWGLWVLVGLSIVLVILGAVFPVIPSDLPELIGNRALSILAILATAAFVHHARNIQDRLESERKRAEAAEDIKTEVLNNLSQEMQTPLRSLTGLLSLMMADCRPDQREALRQVRDGGQQLLLTIENLIDLTRLDGQPLSLRAADIDAILRDAVAAIRHSVEERGLIIVLDPAVRGGDQGILVKADPWAVRRILDNLLSNALRVTPAAGTISVSVRRQDGMVTVQVSDTGTGLPPGLVPALQDDVGSPGTLPHPLGSGLILSHRLARGMKGALLFANQTGGGASVMLSLPSFDQPSEGSHGMTDAA